MTGTDPSQPTPSAALLRGALRSLPAVLVAVAVFLLLEWLTPAGAAANAATTLYVAVLASVLFGVVGSRGGRAPRTGLWWTVVERLVGLSLAVTTVAVLAGLGFQAWPRSAAGLVGATALLAAWVAATGVLVIRLARSDRELPLLAVAAFLGSLLLGGVIAPVLLGRNPVADVLMWLPPAPARELMAWAFAAPHPGGADLGPAGGGWRAAAVIAGWTVATGVAGALVRRRPATPPDRDRATGHDASNTSHATQPEGS